MFDPELTFYHHINLVVLKCYYQLHQLRVVSRSFTHQSTLTLVHAFVTSHIDCCCSLLAGLPLVGLSWPSRTEFCVQLSVLFGGLSKFSSITACMFDVLHLLPISQRLQYSITAIVSLCVLPYTPSYLCDFCCPVSVLAAHQVLRSAARGELFVPWASLAILQWRAFSVVGPAAWSDFPFELQSLLMAHPSKFFIFLKSFFFMFDCAGSASE